MLVLVLVVGFGAASQSDAADRPTASLADFQRTTYTAKDGAPDRIWAIAQTSDGWLWFGGPTGLTRFDGSEFEKVDIASPDGRLSGGVAMLYALPTGGLLIGHLSGGVSILDRGVLKRFDGLLGAGRPMDFVADHEGMIWGTFERCLMRFDGRSWTHVGSDWNVPLGAPQEIYVDSAGTVWLHTRKSISRLRPGTKTFELLTKVEDPGSLVQGEDGVLHFLGYAGGASQESRVLGKPRDRAEASRNSSTEYIDRDGNFWSTIPHINPPSPAIAGLEVLGNVNMIFQDSEGNMWLAGEGELNRLAARKVVHVVETGKTPLGNVRVAWINVAADNLGRIWFTAAAARVSKNSVIPFGSLWRVDGENRPRQVKGLEDVVQVTADAREGVWALTKTGLWQQSGSGFVERGQFRVPDEEQFTAGLSAGCAGGVWAAMPGNDLLRFDGTNWQPLPGTVSPASTATGLRCDKGGDLWLGYASGSVARVNKALESRSIPFAGPNVGAITSISVGRHTLVGGARGLAVLRGDAFVTVSTLEPVLEGVTGIAESPDGYVWVTSARGLVRLWASDLDSTALAVNARTELFDAGDGYPAPTMSLAQPTNPIAVDGDKRVWFSGHGGLAFIESARVPPASQLSRPVFKSLDANGRSFNVAETLSLPQGTRNLEIAYTALRSQHPDRLHFRYRLEGVDDAWIDVAQRRRASYTNLPPGAHRFLLDVSDEFGAWSNTPSALVFDIAPTFFQSRTFEVLAVAGAFSLLAIVFRLRVRQRERRLERYLVERHSERERIARELHDTLLQGTQAFILKVHAATTLTGQNEPVHKELDAALDQATNVMVEARNRIEDLREHAEPAQDLDTVLIRFGQDLMQGSNVEFKAIVEGSRRELVPEVLREAGLIGREALLNALHHGKPSSIELHIGFTDEMFQMSIRDDGGGFDEKMLLRPPGGRHWGLPGMQERAGSISAQLGIRSRKGLGTEVELCVPGAFAYARVAPPAWWHGWRNALK